MQHNQMKIGGRYNWRNQSERLVYLGQPTSGASRGWHQFALVSEPDVVWCEVLDADLASFEESERGIEIYEFPQAVKYVPIKRQRSQPAGVKMSARQWRKHRKASNRAQQPKQGGAE